MANWALDPLGADALAAEACVSLMPHTVTRPVTARVEWLLLNSNFVLVQTKMSWRTLFIIWYTRQPLGIKAQGCLVLR